MYFPNFILEDGTTVKYTSDKYGENMTLYGVIIGSNKDNSIYRSLKDLKYLVKEDYKDTVDLVSYTNVNETILCPSCGEDLLENGIFNTGLIFHKLNDNRKEEVVSKADINNYILCASCEEKLTLDKADSLSRYFNIIPF